MFDQVTQIGQFEWATQLCGAACLLAFFMRRPSWREALSIVGAALVIGSLLQILAIGFWWYGFGVTAALWAILAPYFGRKSVHPSIGLLLIYPGVGASLLSLIQPQGGSVMDRYLLAADCSFGACPGMDLLRLLSQHLFFFKVCEIAYLSLPVALAAFFHTSSAKPLVVSSMLMAFSGFVGYALFPAVGFVVAFHAKHPNPSELSAFYGMPMFADGHDFRNTMPSLHTGWGVLLLAAACRLNWRWIIGAVAYLLPMLTYTEINGHYFCDMLAGTALAAAAWSAAHRRWNFGVLNMAVVLGWLATIRFGLPLLYLSPIVPWSLALGTVATAIWTFQRVSQKVRSRADGLRSS